MHRLSNTTARSTTRAALYASAITANWVGKSGKSFASRASSLGQFPSTWREAPGRRRVVLFSSVVGMSALGVLAWSQFEAEALTEGKEVGKSSSRGKYVLYKEIGRGGFSSVHLAVDTENDELVAAKIFDPRYASIRDIQSEIDILRYLGKHPHIVCLRDVLFLANETIMFTDLVAGGELFDFIVEMGSISEQDASRLLRDVCEALDYIHTMGVCHRDLKPENLLLSSKTNQADIKIADFGLSRRQRNGEEVVERMPSGTIAYWAPEIVRRQPQNLSVDMWSFGVLAYIALTGVHPFDVKGDKSDPEIISAIAKGQYDVENSFYKNLSDDAKDFLASLLHADPSKRLTAKQALDHPWLQGRTCSTKPLPEGHAKRLLKYQRIQKLRANILTVIMGIRVAQLQLPAESDERSNSRDPHAGLERTRTVNMDMFKEAFDLFDKDHSGDITIDELEQMMISLGLHLSKAQLNAIMTQADTDKNGKISFTEFVDIANKRLLAGGEFKDSDIKAAFKIFDTNGDGFISLSELEYMMKLLGAQITHAEVVGMLQEVDVNNDGRIDYNEFVQFMCNLKKDT